MAQITSGRVGILADQNMFDTGAGREGILDARRSFIRMINTVFTRNPVAFLRPDAVAALDAETPITEYLMWRQAEGEQQVQPIPPSTEYDAMVYSIEERDGLLLDPDFQLRLGTGTLRVLVNGLSNPTPQWSVWEATAPEIGINAEVDPETVYEPVRMYDFPAFGDAALSMSQRNILLHTEETFTRGSRVLVQGDGSTGGFWAIWKYDPENGASDEHGFVLARTQTYRTNDFWSYIDWYAEGYSASQPPVVSYPNAGIRNANENPVPTTNFVKIEDDGYGRWAWTAFADGAWNIVARERGTIQFSEKLYDANREIIFEPQAPAPSIDKLRRVIYREGSWEFRVMIDIVRDSGVLTDQEINEVFFSMLHFVHSQQDQVSWAFKTSFMNIGGYDESLRPVPVQPVDNTQNLLDYVEEVKPYRVKTRDFTRSLSPDIDVVPAFVSDFDLPPYYDATTGQYRILSLASEADLEILRTVSPYKDWYENYANFETNEDNWNATTYNPVRRMDIEMAFDRVDHMPVVAEVRHMFVGSYTYTIDTPDLADKLVAVRVNGDIIPSRMVENDEQSVTIRSDLVSLKHGDEIHIIIHQGLTADLAADRIERFYNPVRAEKNIRAMMGLSPYSSISGGSFDMDDPDYDVAYSLDADETVSGYGLADPERAGNRPEELVVIGTSESIKIEIDNIESEGTGETMEVANLGLKVINVPPSYSGSTFDIAWGEQEVLHEDNVLVWRNGYRAIPDLDYTVNLAGKTVSVNTRMSDNSRVQTIKVRTVGAGSFNLHTQIVTELTPDNLYLLDTPSAPYQQRDYVWVDAVYGDDTVGLRRVYDYSTDVTADGMILDLWSAVSVPFLITTQTGSDAISGGIHRVEIASEDGSYTGIDLQQGDNLIWATVDGYDTDTSNLAHSPTSSPEEFIITNESVSYYQFPTSLGAPHTMEALHGDARGSLFYNHSNDTLYYVDAEGGGGLLWQYTSAQSRAQFHASYGMPSTGTSLFNLGFKHLNDGKIMTGYYAMHNGTFWSTFMVFNYDENGIYHIGTHSAGTQYGLYYQLGAAGEHPVTGNIYTIQENVYGNNVYFRLPPVYDADQNVTAAWRGGYTTNANTSLHGAPSSLNYTVSASVYGRNYSANTAHLTFVPRPNGAGGMRVIMHNSRGRVRFNQNAPSYLTPFVQANASANPDGFFSYWDIFHGGTITPQVMSWDKFDSNLYSDQRKHRDGSPDTRTGTLPLNSEYVENFSCQIDPHYPERGKRYMMNFMKKYEGLDDAPHGIAFGSKFYYYNVDTETFEFIHGATADVYKAEISFVSTPSSTFVQMQNPTIYWSPDDWKIRMSFANNNGSHWGQPHNSLVVVNYAMYKPEGAEVTIPTVSLIQFDDYQNMILGRDSFFMASAKPSTDLMEPKEVGDYDARPVDVLAHNIGAISGRNTSYLIRVYDTSRTQEDIENDHSTTGLLRVGKDAPEWSSADAYRVGECTKWNGVVYRAIVEVQGISPSTATYWQNEGRAYNLFFCSDARARDRILAEGEEHAELHNSIEGQMYVQRTKSWEYVKSGSFLYSADYLRGDHGPDVTEIEVNYGGMGLTPPTYQKERVDGDDLNTSDAFEEAGVIWINDERIEFFGIREEVGYYVLTDIRRGTHGTRIGNEARAVQHHIGDGSTRSFILSGSFSDTAGVEVVVHDAIRDPSGTPRVVGDYTGYDVFIPQSMPRDVTLERNAAGIVVNFVKAPAAGAEIILAKSSPPLHRSGSRIIDGRIKYITRPDVELGGEVSY